VTNIQPEKRQSFGFVYLMVSRTKGWYKIGRTKKSSAHRLKHLREAAPRLDIRLDVAIPSDDYERLERHFLDAFRNNRVASKNWEEMGAKPTIYANYGASEWFELDDHQVQLVRNTAATAWTHRPYSPRHVAYGRTMTPEYLHMPTSNTTPWKKPTTPWKEPTGLSETSYQKPLSGNR
jgi:hypothetical protein